MLGARPQFIKAAPVHRAMMKAGITEILLHTGQHHDAAMSDIFFSELGLNAPDISLGISGGGHGDMTGRMLIALEQVMTATPCDAVLVYGDTNSTLAGALAASKLGIPVIHQEAGLRSFNRSMPEEVNRIATDHLADLLLAPTRRALERLGTEGLASRAIHVGDVMLDIAIEGRRRAEALATTGRDVLLDLGLHDRGHAILTLHRAESTDVPNRLATLLDASVAAAGGRPIIFPVHPRTRGAIQRDGLELSTAIRSIAPLGYIDMTRLVSTADVVMTDSGGLQKEAYFHRVPCVTFRSETEWPETIAAGWNRLWTEPRYASRREINDYGSGSAAETSVRAIDAFIRDGVAAAVGVAAERSGTSRTRDGIRRANAARPKPPRGTTPLLEPAYLRQGGHAVSLAPVD